MNIGENSVKITEPGIMLVERNIPFGYTFNRTKHASAIIIRVHPNIYTSNDDDDFFRAFHQFGLDGTVFNNDFPRFDICITLPSAARTNGYMELIFRKI